MKELSIEEKAKLYDESIERAKNHYYNDGLTLEQYETIDIIFPELKESEDERIRKEIVEHFKETIDNIRAEEEIPREGTVLIANMRRWIDWLEKQGKQPDFANKEYWRGYREGKQEIMDKYAEIKKQGEQKPAVWSEEDEKMFELALNMIEWYSGKNEDKSKSVSDYLKSLKERIINGN